MLSSCLGYILNATCIISTSGIVSVTLVGSICSEDDIERNVFMLFGTLLTFDLILRPMDIFRHGFHTYLLYYTFRGIISMNASFYSILPSKVKVSPFCLNGQPTIM